MNDNAKENLPSRTRIVTVPAIFVALFVAITQSILVERGEIQFLPFPCARVTR